MKICAHWKKKAGKSHRIQRKLPWSRLPATVGFWIVTCAEVTGGDRSFFVSRLHSPPEHCTCTDNKSGCLNLSGYQTPKPPFPVFCDLVDSWTTRGVYVCVCACMYVCACACCVCVCFMSGFCCCRFLDYSGLYIAPVTGLYTFSLHLMSNRDTAPVVDIRSDTQIFCT